MSRAHSSGQALQDARCPSASLLHGYSWRIVYGTYDGSNHYKNLTLQVRFNPRSLRLSHCITCWPVLANIAENLPHALNHIMVSFMIWLLPLSRKWKSCYSHFRPVLSLKSAIMKDRKNQVYTSAALLADKRQFIKEVSSQSFTTASSLACFQSHI